MYDCSKALPKWIKKLKCVFGVFCPQIQFSSSTAMGVTQKLQAIPLCESTRLEGLDAFEWKILVKFRATIDEKGKVTAWIDPEEDKLNDPIGNEKGDDHKQKEKDAV